MAKTEGDQSIPSEWLDSYRATLGEQRPNTAIHKRVPYRLPSMQKGGSNVSAAQRKQRNRFLLVRDKFKTLSAAEKARWYAAMPPYSSLLWYYNYFMLSGLMDVLGADARGASVIKSIQNRTIDIAVAGTTITHVTAIDAAKAVVMMFGASYFLTMREDAELNEHFVIVPVYPVWGTLSNTNVSLTWSVLPDEAAKVAVQVIEYI